MNYLWWRMAHFTGCTSEAVIWQSGTTPCGPLDQTSRESFSMLLTRRSFWHSSRFDTAACACSSIKSHRVSVHQHTQTEKTS
jgi:hypothetical protein